jgi:hypothetical protein
LPTLKFPVRIDRKQDDLPAFVVVPASTIASWKLEKTTTVEATLDAVPLGRRSLQRLDEQSWFIELRQEHLAALEKEPGERATLVLTLASTRLPAELKALIESDDAARARWEAHTAAQKRMLREQVLEAKTSATRERRARRALLPVPAPPPARVSGLGTQPQPLELRVIGSDLPPRTFGPYEGVSVGLVHKAGCPPTELFSHGARRVSWDTRIEVFEKGGAPAFRGPAVNGPPQQRFLFLSWIARTGKAATAMFRRAKLRLDEIPAEVLARALKRGTLVARVTLTAEDGSPICASVRPPSIRWE